MCAYYNVTSTVYQQAELQLGPLVTVSTDTQALLNHSTYIQLLLRSQLQLPVILVMMELLLCVSAQVKLVMTAVMPTVMRMLQYSNLCERSKLVMTAVMTTVMRTLTVQQLVHMLI